MAGRSAILTIKILADAKSAAKGVDDASSKVGKFGGAVSKAAVPAAAGLAGLGAAALKAGRAAADDAQSQALLAQALKNSTGATDAGVAKTEDWISKTSAAAAVSDDELRPALATLARATGDAGKSQDAMALALDISAATGKDLQGVSAALAKGYAGNTSALGKMVPGLDKGVLATKDMNKITEELARTTGGAAATAAGTAAGQMKGMTIQMNEAEESLGAALLPALDTGARMLASFAGWVQQNTTVVLVVVGVLAAFAGAILVVNAALKAYQAMQLIVSAATKIWAAMQWALNAAMSANPIGLIVIAIIALIALVVILWKKNEGFRNFVIGMWKAIAGAASAAWRGIKAAASAVISWLIGAGKAIGSFFKAVWTGIKTAAAVAWDGIKTVVKTVIGLIRGYIDAYKLAVLAVWNLISETASTAWKGLKTVASGVLKALLNPLDTVKDTIDKVTGAVQKLVDWIKKIKIPKISLPKIPGLSTSAAVATSPTLRGVGATAAAGGTVININVTGTLNDADTARALRRVLRDDSRRRRGVRVGPGLLT